MKDVVTATEAKFKFGELLSEVSFGKRWIKIKKQKKAVAALIPIEDLEEYQALKLKRKHRTRQELLESVDRLRRSLPKPPPGSPDAVQLIREIRQSAR